VFQLGGNIGTAAGRFLQLSSSFPMGRAVRRLVLARSTVRHGDPDLGQPLVWQLPPRRCGPSGALDAAQPQPQPRDLYALVVLALLVFTKNIYMASFTSYYTFYVIERFDVSVQGAQLLLFLFLGAAAAGTIAGGLIGDRIGAKAVIWVSILGVLPFTLMLPYADLFWTAVLTVIIGIVLASAFPAIVVFAQELVPGRVGLIAGVFFGFAFGMSGIAAAVLGQVADARGIVYVYQVCSFLPFLGLLTVLLPKQNR
jgi:FSR family fosmidomycin resistance protein-like MFS transporter